MVLKVSMMNTKIYISSYKLGFETISPGFAVSIVSAIIIIILKKSKESNTLKIQYISLSHSLSIHVGLEKKIAPRKKTKRERNGKFETKSERKQDKGLKVLKES